MQKTSLVKVVDATAAGTAAREETQNETKTTLPQMEIAEPEDSATVTLQTGGEVVVVKPESKDTKPVKILKEAVFSPVFAKCLRL